MTATMTALPGPSRVVAWSRVGDELLAGRAAAGNAAAFSALYERYYGPLLGYTRSILTDAEDARDATQNALESALRALPGRDTGRALRPWLYKIAHNEAIDIMRRRRPQTELTAALEPTVPGPEVGMEQRGRLAQLVDDLQTLPERQRGALVMRELNGLSYEEIGGALGLTNEAARRAVFDARSALHAAADGRATECVSVRHSISDGDRRSLRARGIRAHLRSCDDCASFQRSIGARRADLHALAPWVSGAAVLGALGITGAGAGTALVTAGGGATATGGGIGWAGLPIAVKSLAVAAAVATTGTAAVEVKNVAAPEAPRSANALATQPRGENARAAALRAATRAARSGLRATTAAPATARPDRVRTSTGTAHSMATSTTISTGHSDAAALAPPSRPAADRRPADAPKSGSATPPQVAKTPEQIAADKLAPLRDAVQQAFADASAIASRGTQGALALATSMLDNTLGPLRVAINKVLAPLGMSLPSGTATTAQQQPATTNVLSPVTNILSSVQNLLANLLGRR